jgi:hypothetical protein
VVDLGLGPAEAGGFGVADDVVGLVGVSGAGGVEAEHALSVSGSDVAGGAWWE